MQRLHHIGSAAIVVVLLVFSGCSPLEPLGDEYTQVGTNPGQGFGGSMSLIRSDTWNLTNISRLAIPNGNVDPIYLDGRLPDAVNYDLEGSEVKRHRVLDWGQLQLKDNGFFRFIFQYSRYLVRFGQDLGPTALCNADLRGLYSVREGTILLYPDRFPDDHLLLQLDATGSLRGSQIITTCRGLDNGTVFESNILLKSLVLNPAKPF